MEQKINEENIENNLVFCIDPRKTFAIKKKKYQAMFFEICHIRTKYIYFLFQLNFDFGFFINHDETDCVSEQFRQKEWI